MSLKMAQHDGNQAIIASQPYRQLSTSTRNMDGIQVQEGQMLDVEDNKAQLVSPSPIKLTD